MAEYLFPQLCAAETSKYTKYVFGFRCFICEKIYLRQQGGHPVRAQRGGSCFCPAPLGIVLVYECLFTGRQGGHPMCAQRGDSRFFPTPLGIVLLFEWKGGESPSLIYFPVLPLVWVAMI